MTNLSTYIIVGDLRRRALSIPTSLTKQVRPSSSALRTTLFNILTHNSIFAQLDFSDLVVADMFCGTGVVGLEMLSLGIKKCTFFDRQMALLKSLKQNIENFSIDEKRTELTVLNLPAFVEDKFDLVFMDPPYENFEILNKQIKCLIEKESVVNGGFIVVETAASYSLPEIKGVTSVLERVVSKRSKLIFLKVG